MNFKLLKVEELINCKDYNKLELYLLNNKDYSYSFMSFLIFMRNEYNNNYIDNIILNFNLKTKLDLKYNKIRYDIKYKSDVKELFNNECVVTKTILINEVAHILEFKDCKFEHDKYNKFNGLYINKNLHYLWDNNLLILDYCLKTKQIYFKINIEKLNNKINKDKKIIEILYYCMIKDYDINNIQFLHILLNINKKYFDNYKYYIDLRNNYC